jgi:putative hydrolase of the HAD superfamily
MGGTLDGDGEHWLDRFARLYADAGVELPREVIHKGFDHAERRAAVDEAIVTADFDTLVRQHLLWQAEVHGMHDPALHDRMAGAFLQPIREAGDRNRPILSRLNAAGLRLGVVSNACGNAAVLCDDLGYSPYLSCVIDSRVVGVAKPDVAIYELALGSLQLPPATVMMVGDSYERDIVPAHGLGLQTAWLTTAPAHHQSHGDADAVIGSLAELVPLLLDQPERMPA